MPSLLYTILYEKLYELGQKNFIHAGPAADLTQGTMQNFNFTHLLAHGIMRGGKN